MSGEGANPYVGLRPFESGDSLYFFGRREQTAELLELLHRTRFLAVVGSSGCGKSSLIRAGLVPALLGGFLVEERDRWRIAVMRPGDAPLENLAAALAAAFADGQAVAGAGRAAAEGAMLRTMTEGHAQAVADDLVARLGAATNLLLLVDQFEEVFAFRGLEDDARLSESSSARRRDRAVRRGLTADFVDLLLRLGEQPSLPVYIVLTLRTDFLGECDLFFGLPEALNRGRYLVPRLDRRQLRRAIQGPALLSGASLAPRLLDHLLNDLGDRSDRLPVLQHALQRTWEVWRGDGGDAIDLDHYRAAGTLREALSRHAEEALRDDDLAATRALFQRLTETDPSLRRIRRPATVSELAMVTGLDRPGVERILERFRAQGRHFVVLSPGATPDDPRVDLSHESLIRQWGRLRRWVDEERESRDEFLELLRGARREAAGRAALLRDPELRIALDWRAAVEPTAAWADRYRRQEDDFVIAMGYLERSERAARAAERRRMRVRNLLIGATAAVLLALSGLTYWALKSRGEARSQEATAQQTANFLVGLFEVSDPGEARGKSITARELLDQGAARISRELADQPEARARLMGTIGTVYMALGLYDRAKPLLEQALQSRESLFGRDHPDVAESLNDLAALYVDEGRYAAAEPVLERALEIRKKALGPDHPDVAESLNDLAALYERQGKEAEAERLFRRSLETMEKALGPDHPDVATCLNNLALLLRDQGKFGEAEPLHKRALEIKSKVLGPDHPEIAISLNNLAQLLTNQGKYAEAEPLYQRALAISEKALGPEHHKVAVRLSGLAFLYQNQGRFAEAESLYRKALAIREKALGPDHPDVAESLNTLATLLRDQGEYAEAEPLYQRALAIRERVLGSDHPDVAGSLNGLALLYQSQERYTEAEPLYRKALAIREKVFGEDRSEVAEVLEGLARLYRLTDRETEAAELEARARGIRERHAAAEKRAS